MSDFRSLLCDFQCLVTRPDFGSLAERHVHKSAWQQNIVPRQNFRSQITFTDVASRAGDFGSRTVVASTDYGEFREEANSSVSHKLGSPS